MKIYCDSSALASAPGDLADGRESAALNRLDESYALFRSAPAGREAGRTPSQRRARDDTLRETLIVELDLEAPVDRSRTHPASGVSYPARPSAPDNRLCRELVAHGLGERDAAHIAAAVGNDCDVFLTRDARTIATERAWRRKRIPRMKFMLPSQLLKFLQTASPRPR